MIIPAIAGAGRTVVVGAAGPAMSNIYYGIKHDLPAEEH